MAGLVGASLLSNMEIEPKKEENEETHANEENADEADAAVFIPIPVVDNADADVKEENVADSVIVPELPEG